MRGFFPVAFVLCSLNLRCSTWHSFWINNAISVTASHVNGSGLVVALNSTESLGIPASGTYAFQNRITDGSSYQVTVSAQPISPTQTCALTNASGTAGTSAIEVTLDCSPYLMAGTMQGKSLSIGNAVTTWAGNGTASAVDAVGTGATFNGPLELSFDGKYFYIADRFSNKIRKADVSTGQITTLAGSGAAASTDGNGTGASFNNPFGLTTDGTNIYVSDTSSHKIRRVNIATTVVTTITGTGSPAYADGTGTAAAFNSPNGLSNDGKYLYIADQSNHRIRKMDLQTLIVTTVAGSGSPAYADGVGTTASFNTPTGVTTDGTNLYVCDYINNRVRKINLASQQVTTIAGDGTAAYLDAVGTAAKLNNPGRLTTDGFSLFIGDQSDHRVRRIDLASLAVSTVAGTGSAAFADGTGGAAAFNAPNGIFSDGVYLYVADYGNNRIRRIN